MGVGGHGCRCENQFVAEFEFGLQLENASMLVLALIMYQAVSLFEYSAI